jgi:hypothetical protein
MTRAEFDALLAAALDAMTAAVPAPTHGDPAAAADEHYAMQEIQLLEAEARSFADAVDRDGKRIPYGSAVVLEGPHGVAVVQAADYTNTITYWWTVVGGRPDRITSGPELMQVLAGAANRSASAEA